MKPRQEVDASIDSALRLLEPRWTGPIIYALLPGGLRFSTLRRKMPGITDRMLSKRLSELQQCGIVLRSSGSRNASGGVYRLTKRGAALGPSFESLIAWQRAGAGEG